MRHMILASLATVTIAISAVPASAQVTLTFEGVGDEASVNDFYNGGTDSAGHSGTNYGINFSSNSLGLIDSSAGGSGNTGNDPSGVTNLFFLEGGAATMNVAAGFDTGFSFYYAANVAGSITVYDGLNASGNILATLLLPTTPNAYYEWFPIGVAFDGIAHSVDFGGAANFITFDNITLGATVPGNPGVPEPASWAMMVFGFGLSGGALRSRRKASVTFA